MTLAMNVVKAPDDKGKFYGWATDEADNAGCHITGKLVF